MYLETRMQNERMRKKYRFELGLLCQQINFLKGGYILPDNEKADVVLDGLGEGNFHD